jgi:glycosyltransferase involved in cell wall biosynthesis
MTVVANDTRPRCVVVTRMPPVPTLGGTCIRVAATVAALAVDHAVTVVCIRPDGPVVGGAARYCASVGASFRHVLPPADTKRGWRRDVRSFVEALTSGAELQLLRSLDDDTARTIDDADLVWVCRLTPFLRVHLPTRRDTPVVIDLDDIDERVLGRHPDVPPLRRRVRVRKTLLARRRLLRQGRAALVCSELDAARMDDRRIDAPCPVRVLPNTYLQAPDTSEPETTAGPGTRHVVFVGRMAYQPNRLGAEWLVEQVWPLVTAMLPDARLSIVGAGSEHVAVPSAATGVHLAGEVIDIAPVLASAAVSVAPVPYGSGTRMKIVEAFAWGIPVVSTTVGAEGLDVADGTTIVLADDPQDFAGAIVRLLADPAAARTIGAAGRRLFHDRYAPDVFIRTVRAIAADARAGTIDTTGVEP